MAKYLIKASYSAEGIKGVMKAGGTARVDAVKKAIEGSDVERELIRYAENAAADALFVNARHDLGGVKQEIIRRTDAPVLPARNSYVSRDLPIPAGPSTVNR